VQALSLILNTLCILGYYYFWNQVFSRAVPPLFNVISEQVLIVVTKPVPYIGNLPADPDNAHRAKSGFRTTVYCLNITNPCSGVSQGYDPCIHGGDCTSLNDGNAGYYCANCPPGLSGQYCQNCDTSMACSFGTLANCCNGTCSVNWESPCGPGQCAAGEVWVPNAGLRYCVSATNPCSSGEGSTNYDLCPLGSTCLNVATVEQNGQYWCYGCPPGLGGMFCEMCVNSKACVNMGTASNCCGSHCVTGWSGICDTSGCATGEKWNGSQCEPDNQ